MYNRLLVVAIVIGLGALLLWQLYPSSRNSSLEPETSPPVESPAATESNPTPGTVAMVSSADTEEAVVYESYALIKPADAATVQRLTVALENKFSAGIQPMGYIRHRFANIAVSELQTELQKSFKASEELQSDLPITIQLFDDLKFDVVVTQWLEGHPGKYRASGIILIDNPTQWSASFYFDGDGTMRGTIESPTHWYRIEKASELPYHVVYESEYVQADM